MTILGKLIKVLYLRYVIVYVIVHELPYNIVLHYYVVFLLNCVNFVSCLEWGQKMKTDIVYSLQHVIHMLTSESSILKITHKRYQLRYLIRNGLKLHKLDCNILKHKNKQEYPGKKTVWSPGRKFKGHRPIIGSSRQSKLRRNQFKRKRTLQKISI